MTDTDDNSGQKAELAPPAYTGMAQVIGHTLTASAAMLAFFFVFQGTLLANFPTLYEKFAQTTFPAFPGFPIGRAALVVLCLVALAFTGWSFLIVHLFITYFDSFLTSGKALEDANGNVSGLFAALRTAYDKPFPHKLLVWTTWAFFLLLVMLWIGLGTIAAFGVGPLGGGYL
ncbi:MAG: hypothetical protein J0J01_31425 [Reyranella sp.]|uniref:hypothetical protein n=1 Tax=Reyranella sp. TaxID=1929291 RepID=UPI001AC073AA|nr:hypothetical protein [Reyranella sp.]MBN9091453.1 hypothetical protein [Reyranella sp.]